MIVLIYERINKNQQFGVGFWPILFIFLKPQLGIKTNSMGTIGWG
jgi:hypothetical protein